MANKQGTKKQKTIENENSDEKLWRPTDEKTEDHAENTTGLHNQSPATGSDPVLDKGNNKVDKFPK